jgi:hypothetical protein
MDKKRKVILAILLMITIGNYSRLAGSENIRAIQFLSIFVMGALSGLLINEFISLFKAKRE